MAQQPARKAPAGKKAAHKKPVKKTTGSRDIIFIAAIGLVVIIAAFIWQSFNTEGFNLTDKTADKDAAVTEIYGVDVVRINEVMSANDSAWYTASGETADWFELINTSDKTIDLNGYVVAKSVDDTDRFVFPETVLGPGEAVLVFCDNTVHNTAGYEYHAPFALSRAGATLMLFNPHGTAVDSVNIPDLDNNISYARIDASTWERSAEYTPGLANTSENHICGGAHHGILENAADIFSALVFGQMVELDSVDRDLALVDWPCTCNCVQHGGFTCAVAADYSDEIAVVEGQVHSVQRVLLVYGAGVEGLMYIFYDKHFYAAFLPILEKYLFLR